MLQSRKWYENDQNTHLRTVPHLYVSKSFLIWSDCRPFLNRGVYLIIYLELLCSNQAIHHCVYQIIIWHAQHICLRKKISDSIILYNDFQFHLSLQSVIEMCNWNRNIVTILSRSHHTGYNKTSSDSAANVLHLLSWFSRNNGMQQWSHVELHIIVM